MKNYSAKLSLLKSTLALFFLGISFTSYSGNIVSPASSSGSSIPNYVANQYDCPIGNGFGYSPNQCSLVVFASVTSNVSCYGSSNGTATASSTGGTGTVTYKWNDAHSTSGATLTACAGTFTVTATDANNCSATASVIIAQPSQLQFGVAGVTTSNFNHTNYVQSWTVPAGVSTITLTAIGGVGGGDYENGNDGGNGARITGTCSVTQGHVIGIIAGGVGTTNYDQDGGAGGGGSFVWDNNNSVLLAVAGGGGGGGDDGSGYNASTSISPNPSGGSGLLGGLALDLSAGGAGAGVLGNGGGYSLVNQLLSLLDLSYEGYGGSDKANGFLGGEGDNSGGDNSIVGGYGGGGGGGEYGGGGGGGYNGGDGLADGMGGAGGGSYFNGTITSVSAPNALDGGVIITYPSVSGPFLPTVNANATCYGGNNGRMTSPSPIGGTSPYTYSWSPLGGTNTTASNLSAGTYTVTVSDAKGCSISASAVITQPASLTSGATQSITPACYGASNGRATASAGGGSSPYTYRWNNMNSTVGATLTAGAGTYTVTVTDANSCTATAYITITQPGPIVESALMTNAPSCHGGTNGNATANASGGTGTITYKWNNNALTSGATLTAYAGTYTVTATDANGCTATASVTITQPAAINLSTEQTGTINCYGCTTGNATATAYGGTGTITYRWNNVNSTTGATLTAGAGTYTVTATDANSCMATAGITITQPAIFADPIIFTGVSCYGGNNGTATMIDEGGITPFTYSWSTGATTSSISGLTVGSYSVISTDADATVLTASVTIPEPSQLIFGAEGYSQLDFNASASIQSWTVPAGITGITVSAAGGQGGADDEYTKVGGYGATIIGTCVVNPGDIIDVVVGGIGASNYNVDGGTGGGGSFVWDNTNSTLLAVGGGGGGGGDNGNGYNGSTTESPNPSGGTGELGGQALDGNAGGGGAGFIGNGGNDGSSSGSGGQDEANGFAGGAGDINGSDNDIFGGYGGGGGGGKDGGGGGGGYNGGDGLATGMGGAGGGSYLNGTITSVSALSEGSGGVVITFPNLGSPLPTVYQNVYCNGGNNGSMTAPAPAGGTSPYTYSWSPSGGNGFVASALSAGTYTITVTDANGCTVSASAAITQPAALTITGAIQTGSPTCNGNTNGTAVANITGGTAPLIYEWNDINTSTGATLTAGAGTYTLTATDANSCTASASVIITQPNTLTITSISQTSTLCNGKTNGTAAASSNGGTGTITYKWNNAGSTTGATLTAAAGTYTVTSTDANSCTASASVIITQPPAIVVTVSQTGTPTCYGNTNGTVTASASGGTGTLTYKWSNPLSSTGATLTAAQGAYRVTVTDANGCTINSSIITTTQPAVLGFSPAVGQTIIPFSYQANVQTWTVPTGVTALTLTALGGEGGGANAYNKSGGYGAKVTGTVTVTAGHVIDMVTGGAGSTNYRVDGGAGGGGTFVWDNNTSVLLAVAGGAGGAGINGNGNSGSTTTSPNSGGGASEGGGSAADIHSGGGGAGFLGNGGGNGSAAGSGGNDMANGLTGGAGDVAESDQVVAGGYGGGGGGGEYGGGGGGGYNGGNGLANGLGGAGGGTYLNGMITSVQDSNVGTGGVTITYSGGPGIPIINQYVTCYDGNNGSISSATASGGTSPYTYSWSGNGGTNATASNLSAGTYTITITDLKGCTETASAALPQPAPISASASQTATANCNGGNGTATAISSGGAGAMTYLWSNNTSGATLNAVAGTYTVTVTDSHGCTARASVSITQPTTVTANASQSSAPNCNGGTGTALATSGGGTGSITYLWNNSATGATLTAVAGTYTVTASDTHGCSATASAVITQPSIVTASAIQSSAPNCNGGTGTAIATATGGTGMITYLWNNSVTGATLTATAGTYTVTAEDVNNCTATVNVMISQPAQLQFSGGTEVTFTATGSVQSWTIPAGVTSLTAIVAGGAGGAGNDGNGGNGAVVTFTANSVTPGNLVNILVGEEGQSGAAGGGGGGTFIWANGNTSNPAVIAGGGGGGGYLNTNDNGENASTTTAANNYSSTYDNTTQVNTYGGGGGSASPNYYGGGGGGGAFNVNGGNGAGQGTPGGGTSAIGGGTGGNSGGSGGNGGFGGGGGGNSGGGGGGGLNGGGGGNAENGSIFAGGGGGGSGIWNGNLYVNASPVTATNTGNGYVMISYPSGGGTPTINENVSCSGGNNGSLTSAAITGGNSPYSYSWSGGAGSNATASNLSAGTYTITVTDSKGCTITASASITQPASLTASAMQTATPSCNGYTNGAAIATASGGTGTITYVWNNSATGATLTAMAGTYTVTATDAHSCTASASVVITQPTQVGVSAGQATAPLCNGGTGTAVASGNGGTSGYTYAWTGGSTGATLTAIAGTYTVTATDANSCTASASVVITQPTQLGVSMSPTSPLCNGGTGTAVTAGNGGTSGYTYSWTGGSTGATLTAMAGTYTVTATDAHSCTASASVVITQPTQVGVSAGQATAPLCNGGTGTAVTAGNGGTSGYIYSWTGGSTGATLTAMAGTYTVTATDAHSCTASASVVITQPTQVGVSAGQATAPLCNGGTGTAVTAGNGGTSGYTYSWTGGSTGATLTAMAGTYTVTATDANSCTASASVVITQPTQVGVSAGQATAPLCNGGTGTAVTAGNGGTSGYTYSWTGGSTGATLTAIAGTYTVTATDANSCTASASVVITQPTQIGVSAVQATAPLCNGGTGTAIATGNGGTSGYTYSWTGGSTGATLTAIAGTYTVTATDANSCTASASVVITQPTQIGVSAVQATAPLCNGGTGTAIATGNGGTSGYTYSWTGGSTGATLTAMAGTYTVTATDAHSCTASASVVITQPTQVGVSAGQATAPLCNGGTGTAVTAGNGGTSGYTYSWTGGSTGATLTAIAGTYTVTVTDANSCTASASVVITQPTQIGVSAVQATAPLCNGGTGTAIATGNGGTSGYTYSWTGGSTGATLTAMAGTYTVTATDAHSCTASASVVITQPTQVGVSAVQATAPLCNGGTGTAIATGNGGTSGYTYSWTGGSTGATLTAMAGTYTVTATDAHSCTASVSVVITQPTVVGVNAGQATAPLCHGGTGSAVASGNGGTSGYTYAWTGGSTGATLTAIAGTYTVTASDANSCTASASVVITQPTQVGVNAGQATAPLCNGGTGTAVAAGNGGTNGYTYAWTGGSTGATLTAIAGTYTVTVSDANSCTASASAVITQPTQVGVSAGQATAPLCNGGTGTAVASGNGGTSGYTYSWTGGSTGATLTAMAGTYTVTATDANSCTASASVVITQPTQVGVSAGQATAPLCNGGTGTAVTAGNGGTSGYTYSWTGGSTGATLTAMAGTYTVTATDAHSCTASASVVITQPTQVGVSAVQATAPLCNGGTGTAVTAGNGGTSGYTYSWTGGSTGATLTAIAGTYTVTATDANSCTASASVVISQPTQIGVSAGQATGPLCNGGTGTAVTAGNGGTSGYTYSWTGGSTGATLTAIAGTYTVTATDAHSCTASASVVITQPTQVGVSAGQATAPLCNGGTGTAVTAGNGGTSGYTYSWTGGSTGATLTAIAGTYTVTATDANSCTASASVVITQPTQIGVSAVQATAPLCNGGTGTAIATGNGGTSGYTYSWTGGSTGATLTAIAGTYTVTATDAHSCTASASVVITQPTQVGVSAGQATAPLCNGGTGTAVTAGNGGTSGYTYSWTGGSTGATLTAMAGTYTVTATDTHGCSATASSIITQPSALTLTTSGTNISCNSGNNGSCSATPGGGISPYTYSWSGGGTGSTKSGCSAGTYTVNVTDHNGCSVSGSVSCTQPVNSVSTNASVTSNVSCYGCSNGSATSAPTGGTSPYTYSWSDNAATASVSNLTAGTYTLTVTDGHGCTASASVSLTQPAVACSTDTHNPYTDFNSSPGSSATTLWVHVDTKLTSNSLPHNGDYLLFTGGTLTLSNITSNPAISNAAFPKGEIIAVNGVVTPTTSYNALNNEWITQVPPGYSSSDIFITAGVFDASNGFSVAAGKQSSVSGVFQSNYGASFSSQWFYGLACYQPEFSYGNVGGAGQVASISGGVQAGTPIPEESYLVAGGSGGGGSNYTGSNSSTDNFTACSVIPQNNCILTASISSQTNVSCSGGNNGAATVTAILGTTPYTYSWSNGGTGSSVSSLTSGTYSVTVNDVNGCSASASVAITQPGTLAHNASCTSNCSHNGGNDGSCSASPTGGNSPYSYSWSGGCNSATKTGCSAGTYTITVTDNGGCSVTGSVTCTQPPVLCHGGTCTHTVTCNDGNDGICSSTPTGGTAPYTYSWTGGCNSSTKTGCTAGSYTLTVTDNHGYTCTGAVTCGQPGVLAHNASCTSGCSHNGGNDGVCSSSPSGGNAPYTYSWNGGCNNANRTGCSAGTYTITINDNNGCTVTGSVTCTQPPVLSHGGTCTHTVTCNGGNDGICSSAPTGGTAPYTYSWTGGCYNSSKTGCSAGTYTLTVTDNHGYTCTGSVTCSQPGSALNHHAACNSNCSHNGGNDGSCSASPTGGNSPYSYSWSGGCNSATKTGCSAGTYTITVTDNGGCSVTGSVTCTQPPILCHGGTCTHTVTCNDGNDGICSSTPTGGTAPYTYSWTGGCNSSTKTGCTAGSYTLTVTDNHGYTCTGAVTCGQPGALSHNASCTSGCSHNGGNDGVCSSSPSGGNSPYSYSWTGGCNSATKTGCSAGTYTITVTDNGGCSVTGSVTCTQPPVLCHGGTCTHTVSCNQGNDGICSSAPTGGTAPYTYSWTGGCYNSSKTGCSAGTYTLTVTDNHGYTCTGSVTCSQPGSALNHHAACNSNCSHNGGNDGSCSASPTGGNSPYSYSWSGGCNSATKTGCSAGTYTITVTDNGGCSVTGSVTCTQPPILCHGGTCTHTVSCNQGNDGICSSAPTGGTAPYTYSWTGGCYNSSKTGCSAGTYTLTVTDNHGYTCTGAVTCGQPAALSHNASCTSGCSHNGGNDGVCSSSPSGGNSPYSYSWTGGCNSATKTGCSAGTYTITVTDNGGCSVTGSVTCTQPPVLCHGGTCTHTVSCNQGNDGICSSAPTGGTAPYTYSWIGGCYNSSKTGCSAGTYTLTVTDNHGYTCTGSVTCTQPVSALDNLVSCNSNCTQYGGNNGVCSTTPSGGNSPYRYSWSSGGTNYSITNCTAGNYTITVTDNNGCSVTGSVTCTQPALVECSPIDHNPFTDFNSTPGSTATSMWFHLNIKLTSNSLPDNGDIILFTEGNLTLSDITSNPMVSNTSIPDGEIVASNAVNAPTTTFTGTYWVTMVPPGYSSTGIFITGAILNSTNGFSVNAGKQSELAGEFQSNYGSSFTSSWFYGIACYQPEFSYNEVSGSGEVTSIATGGYQPGTPLNELSHLVAGGSGGGGSNFTGSNSSTDDFTACEYSGGHSSHERTVDQTTSTNTSEINNVVIYPNPNSGNFAINGMQEGMKIEIYDMLGQNISSGIAGNQSIQQFSITNQPNGVYLIRILSNDGTLVRVMKISKMQ